MASEVTLAFIVMIGSRPPADHAGPSGLRCSAVVVAAGFEEDEQGAACSRNVIVHQLARALRVPRAHRRGDRAMLLVCASLAVRERELHAEVAIGLLMQPLQDR